MPSKQTVISNLDWLTERLSNRIWTVSVGVLATCLAYVIESIKKDGAPFLLPEQVAIPAAIALSSLIFDVLQYYAATQQNIVHLKQMEKASVTELQYDTNSLFYKMRLIAFRCKIILCVMSAVWLVVLSSHRVYSLV